MTCRSCKHEFCWLCKANWAGHASCAKYVDSELQKERTDAARAQNELQRFIHFFDRFNNHAKAIKFAEPLRKEAADRMVKLEQLRGGGGRDVEYLLTAINTVIDSHHTLQWTYAYGYFMEPSNRIRALFESNQSQLETLTDKLHELTELPAEELSASDRRIQIVSNTRMVQKFRTNVINAIQSEYDAPSASKPRNPTR